VLFHTPQGDARAVVPTSNASFAPVNFTVCTWLRTSDTMGGLLAYSAPLRAGPEFAVYLRPLNATIANPYVGCHRLPPPLAPHTLLSMRRWDEILSARTWLVFTGHGVWVPSVGAVAR
jgi:hypothetical protein